MKDLLFTLETFLRIAVYSALLLLSFFALLALFTVLLYLIG